MQIFKENLNRHNFSILKKIPISFENQQGFPSIASFVNGKTAHIGCLKCINPRCLYFNKEEIECDSISDFPNDKSINVCPVEAIAWDNVKNVPLIDTKKCINCGICVRRCPVGAIYFTENCQLMINTFSSQYSEVKPLNETTMAMHTHQIKQLLKIPRNGIYFKATDQIFELIYSKMFHLKSNYHNIICRNLLIALGCKCSMRRIGDVYTRMDAIYNSCNGSFGAVEIEFGRDTLDAARGILDDIAVLNTRYGIDKYCNKAIVICLQLPNARQGYWQVVKDVKDVEGIKIGTITVGALMILIWYGCFFEPENDRYYIDYNNMDLIRILCTQIDCNHISISSKELGIIEPMK